MDLDEDGKVDILSGSYSRMNGGMAGLFQVLKGTKDGFLKAQPLKGTDGEPLIIPADRKNQVDNICTRPTAADIDGDGKLDIVTGNFRGTFAVFKGLGKGKFEPKHRWLMSGGARLAVRAHSDPFLIDWDGDGDLDLLSGSGQGGAFLCRNTGSKTEPSFAKPVALVPARGYSRDTRLGDKHITGPQTGTRVYVDDVNGDGKLDLLVGDNCTLNYAAAGLDAAAVKAKLAEWTAKQQKLSAASRGLKGEKRKAWMAEWRKHYAERKKILRTERTGFVWVYYRQ